MSQPWWLLSVLGLSCTGIAVDLPQPTATVPAVAAPSLEVRAQLSAIQHTLISAELNARIASLPWREGQVIKAGQVVVSFDCRSYQAQLEQAQAQRKEAAVTLDAQKRLSQLKASSELEQLQTQARLERAQAEVSLQQVMVSRCQIAAPFSGRIGSVSHQAHEVVAPGQQLLELVNDKLLEVEMIVPSANLKALKKGSQFSLQLDELSAPLAAEVERVGAMIDPVSQSVRIFGRLLSSPSNLLPGMSGLAKFEVL